MEDSVVSLYVGEIMSQAEAAQIALQDLRFYQDKDPRRAISASIALLGSAAAISKLLGGDPPPQLRPGATSQALAEHEVQSEFAAKRGKALRRVYKRGAKKVDVLHERSVRNGFEHVDHRLDRYNLESKGKSLVRRSLVNGRANCFGENHRDVVFLGVIDYQSGDIIVMDDEISVTRLGVAIDYILERSSEWLKQHAID